MTLSFGEYSSDSNIQVLESIQVNVILDFVEYSGNREGKTWII